jgi:hypothetical protein
MFAQKVFCIKTVKLKGNDYCIYKRVYIYIYIHIQHQKRSVPLIVIPCAVVYDL